MPVSAAAKLTPVTPMSAARNSSRSRARAQAVSSSRESGSSVPASAERMSRICGSVLWIAGVMMCDGRSWTSCTMYSPRSVSTALRPSASSASPRSISSVAIDLLFTTRRAPRARAMSSDDLARGGGRVCPVHMHAELRQRCLEPVQPAVEVGERLAPDRGRRDLSTPDPRARPRPRCAGVDRGSGGRAATSDRRQRRRSAPAMSAPGVTMSWPVTPATRSRAVRRCGRAADPHRCAGGDPSRCMRQARSVLASQRAARPPGVGELGVGQLDRDLGELVANTPPNPQHVSGSVISTMRAPVASSNARLAPLMPRLRRP